MPSGPTKVGKFNFGENVFIMHSDENPLFFTTSIGLPGGRPSLVNDLLQAAPTIPVYDPNRKGGFGGADSTIHQSITLKPLSYDSKYSDIVLTEEGLRSLKVVGIFECVF